MLVSLSYFWADYLHLGIVLHNSALSIVAKKEVNVKNFFPNIDFSHCLTAQKLLLAAYFYFLRSATTAAAKHPTITRTRITDTTSIPFTSVFQTSKCSVMPHRPCAKYIVLTALMHAGSRRPAAAFLSFSFFRHSSCSRTINPGKRRIPFAVLSPPPQCESILFKVSWYFGSVLQSASQSPEIRPVILHSPSSQPSAAKTGHGASCISYRPETNSIHTARIHDNIFFICPPPLFSDGYSD